MNKHFLLRIDWITLLIYFLLVLFGMLNIYSISFENIELSFYDINNSVGKQFWFFIFCLFIGIPIMFLKPSFFDNISFLSYIVCILLLTGGDKAGIVLTEFRLDGNISKPSISFRPLSSAPGLLRDVFNIFRSDKK